jgi:hypothetical protein
MHRHYDIETLNHVFTCQQDEVVTHRKEQFQNLLEDDSLRCPFSHSVAPSHMLLTQAYQDQTQIEWDQLLRGRISKLWSEVASFTNLENGLPPDPTWGSYLPFTFTGFLLGRRARMPPL